MRAASFVLLRPLRQADVERWAWSAAPGAEQAAQRSPGAAGEGGHGALGRASIAHVAKILPAPRTLQCGESREGSGPVRPRSVELWLGELHVVGLEGPDENVRHRQVAEPL